MSSAHPTKMLQEHLSFPKQRIEGSLNRRDTKKHLEWVIKELNGADDSNFQNPETIKSLIFDHATENGRGQVLWPVRMALSGKDKSPDPFTLIYILGKEESIERLEKAVDNLV